MSNNKLTEQELRYLIRELTEELTEYQEEVRYLSGTINKLKEELVSRNSSVVEEE